MIVVVGLIVAFVLVLIFSNRKMRNCRWREDRRGDRDGQRMFRCAACGAVRFTSDGKPPRVCAINEPDKGDT